HEDLERAGTFPDETDDEAARETIKETQEKGDIADVRVITHTIPSQIQSIPKKTPEIMETRIGGGSIEERKEFAFDLIENGGEHTMNDIFRAGEFLDASGITKGKGTQGPVKRWGVQKRKRKHARQGWVRRIGNLGPWNPSRVRSTVPQMGQTGYHQRTELNKRLLDMGDGSDINPDGGFVNYGEVDGSYALIKGSLPGPTQRLVRFRPAVRPSESPRLDPEIRYISTESNQG
ncbi:MAG: 50S ribosomal protein L3, partial [Halobacteriaceae archaeon]